MPQVTACGRSPSGSLLPSSSFPQAWEPRPCPFSLQWPNFEEAGRGPDFLRLHVCSGCAREARGGQHLWGAQICCGSGVLGDRPAGWCRPCVGPALAPRPSAELCLEGQQVLARSDLLSLRAGILPGLRGQWVPVCSGGRAVGGRLRARGLPPTQKGMAVLGLASGAPPPRCSEKLLGTPPPLPFSPCSAAEALPSEVFRPAGSPPSLSHLVPSVLRSPRP